MKTKKEEPEMEGKKNSDLENDQLKSDNASRIIKKYMYWSMGAGLIPIPLFDIAAVSGVQLKMLNELSKIYEIEFSENMGKSIVAVLLGSITADSLSRSTFTSFIKTIPIIGIIGSVSMPLYSGAATWAIGKVFVQHFASGGTFLDFDPKKVKEYFTELYEQGKTIAKNMQTSKAE